MPLSDIIEKIKEKSNLSEEKINEMINTKLSQLSGLISKEGAAHIVANELGVKIFEATGGKLQIKNILAGMRSVETVGKVQQVFDIREFTTQNGRSGKVASVVIGDETGVIRLVLWGDAAEYSKKAKEGDIVRIENGYVRENQGRKEVHLNERCKFFVNPEGESVGEVKTKTINRKKVNTLNEGDNDVELLGTIVQVFEPRFFEVCPECGKRARLREDAYFCDTHGKVAPDFSYVLNVFLDDGTDNIRCVFFRNQANNLLQKEKEAVLRYKDDPAAFEAVKTELLGNIIKVVGRVVKNQMFDRLEFMTQLVFPNPDPEDEIKKVEQEKEVKEETVG
jgi:ssDNA-binding replication factor A large subunit